MFIHIERRALILKMVERKVFLMKPKHKFIYPNEKNEFVGLNHENKGDYHVNLCLSQLRDEL